VVVFNGHHVQLRNTETSCRPSCEGRNRIGECRKAIPNPPLDRGGNAMARGATEVRFLPLQE
jgi:hypothetical protein